MASPMICRCILGFLMILGIANLEITNGHGECGDSSPDKVALTFFPCMVAALYEDVYVSNSCCSRVREIGEKNPDCLCAVFMSKTIGLAGIDHRIAITIPKRCNFVDRPVGRKCGGYSLV